MIEYKELEKVLEIIGNQISEQYKNNLKSKDINSSNQLTNSITIDVQRLGHQFNVVLNLEDYWKYIEYGRKPGRFPNISKLIEWIKKKPVLPHKNENGKLPTQQQLAYIIGKHISENGIKPKNILENTINKLNNIEDILLTAISIDVENYLTETIK